MGSSRLNKNQRGIVSFFVVFIIMLVLTLIVLAFAKLVRREQRQTLDRQLNTQAFYAAETGVNDAIDALRNNPGLLAADYSTNCDTFITAAGLTGSRQLDGPGGVISYSCLLVDTSPPELNYNSVPIDESVVAPITAPAGQSISELEISWSDAAGDTGLTGCPAAGSHPGGWPGGCEVGMLRIELLPFQPAAGGTSRVNMLRNRFVAYAQPAGSTTAINYLTASDRAYQSGGNYAVRCNSSGPRQCTVRITNLDQVDGATNGVGLRNGYLRLRSIYKTTAVTIRAYSNATTRTDFVGAQAEIDVTGRANDVLRRIKVNAPLDSDRTATPEYALQSTLGQCKRFEIAPLSYLSVQFPGGSAANSVCNPSQTLNR